MKFTCTVDIDAPMDKTVAIFSNADHLKEWQDGFQSIEHLSGQPGQPGAKARMLYKRGKGEMELIETIHVNDLPREFSALYEHKHMVNTMTTRFTELAEGRTRLSSDVDYVKLNGFVIKIISKLFPGMAKKQVQKWLNQFKAHVERIA